jgi:RHS repeat-associated protein
VLDLRFPGQRYDAATGLHYNYHRDYDPTVGRYVQSDPIGLNGGLSTYGYGEGAPLVFSDPLGLQGKGLGGMLGRMIARPIVQRMGGGLLAKAASQAAKARSQARRAAELAQRMQGIWGRIARSGKRGAEEVPQGCADYVRVNKSDPAADAIAQRLGGVSRVRFPGRFKDREFDVLSDEFVGQTKPANFELGSSFRNQAKATFEAAIELQRIPYFYFDGPPSQSVIGKLAEYSKRYGIDPVIDTTPL